jgi:hypothetical protein
MIHRIPPRLKPDDLNDPVVICVLITAFFMAVGACYGCSQSTLNRVDPVLAQNSNNYQSCPRVPPPGCRTDDQQCPLEGNVCIDLDPTACAGGPCSMGGKRRPVDAGTADAGR